MFSTFRDADFATQVDLLTRAGGDCPETCVSSLIDLFTSPTGDRSIDTLVHATLMAVLEKNHQAVLEGLRSPHEELVSLCAHVVGMQKPASAAPVIHTLLKKGNLRPGLMFELLSALDHLEDPQSLHFFRQHLMHPEILIATLCVRHVGRMRDTASLPVLARILKEAEGDNVYQQCSIHTWEALKALAAMQTPDSLKILAAFIHHRNPTVRRGIGKALVQAGASAVPILDTVFSQGSEDAKTLAATALGSIGNKECAAVLLKALDQGRAKHPNVRYALFEALSAIGGIKAMVALIDALLDTDELSAMAAARGLEKNASPQLASKLSAAMQSDPTTGQTMIRSLVRGQAHSLLHLLSGDTHLQPMLDQAGALDQHAKDAADSRKNSGRILAVDDSGVMRAYYRQLLESGGHTALTAEDGPQAMSMLEAGKKFDLLIIDLNMPGMTGTELMAGLRSRGITTPAVLVTTESMTSQMLLAEQSGFAGTLTKPFQADVLLDLVSRVLSGDDS